MYVEISKLIIKLVYEGESNKYTKEQKINK